tara:strand:- start:698 stop:1402 length:705 start_codon:yes stop_codon:yes gene_type:complete
MYPLDKYKWYHKIQIDENHWTPGDIRINTNPDTIKHFDCIDFTDKTVLDIGCRDGLHSFEAEKRGAKSILGIDTCLSLGAVEFLIPHFNSKVKMLEKSLYDMDGQFDIIIFAGVLYHLKYPFLALKKISELLRNKGTVIIETIIWSNTENKSLLFCPKKEDSSGSTCTMFNYKGLIDNLEIFGLVEPTFIPEDKYNDDKHRRITLRCIKRTSSIKKKLHSYWEGKPHNNWHKEI